MAKKSVYEIITQRFIDALKEDTIPWHKTWKGGLPMNFVSKRPYNGINLLMLSLYSNEQYYMTFKQANGLGGKIKKGSKSIPIVFWSFVESRNQKNNDGTPKKVGLLRYYRVFPLSCVEGIKMPDVEVEEVNPIEEAEKVLARNVHTLASGRPAYSPTLDEVYMPDRNDFNDAEAYYSTYYHELTHWTGHKDRLNREEGMANVFGDHLYSKEELVAEIGASILCSVTGIENKKTIENSKAYIQSWIRRLSNEPKLIISAASQARKATEHLTGDAEAEDNTEAETVENPAELAI